MEYVISRFVDFQFELYHNMISLWMAGVADCGWRVVRVGFVMVVASYGAMYDVAAVAGPVRMLVDCGWWHQPSVLVFVIYYKLNPNINTSLIYRW